MADSFSSTGGIISYPEANELELYKKVREQSRDTELGSLAFTGS